MRILLVEDDDDLRQSVTAYLRATGFAVDAVATGKMALVQADVSPTDAIVLDVQLPDTDGFAVCRALRAAGSSARILMAVRVQKRAQDRLRPVLMTALVASLGFVPMALS